jgi:hypothetical protein
MAFNENVGGVEEGNEEEEEEENLAC